VFRELAATAVIDRRAVLVAVMACSCRGGGAAPAPPPASAATLEVDASSPALDQGMPRVECVLDDPRLAAARQYEQSGDDASAAHEVDRVRAAVNLTADRACAWDYLAGRLHAAAEEWSDAASAFARAHDADAGAACPLADYARLREAESLVHAGRFPEALAAASAIGAPLSAANEASLARADALSGSGDRAGAVLLWRTLLSAEPHGLRWVDTSMQLTRALLDGVDGPSALRAKEALERVTRVVVEAPSVADKLHALELRAQAAIAGGAPQPPPLTAEERLRQAQAWLDAAEPVHARPIAAAVLSGVSVRDASQRKLGCRAATLVAQTFAGHGRASQAADAWGEAIDRCAGDDSLVTALYSGGKSSSAANRPAEAQSRFAALEARFPDHHLADDARLRGATTALEDGDTARAVGMLTSLPDAYPEGDVRGEALFRAAIADWVAGDLDGARAALDRAVALGPEAPGSPASGRAQYFRGRVAEKQGDVADAKARYAAVVGAFPLSYYMLLAYARLRALDPALARSTVQTALDAEPPAPFLTHEEPLLASPAFARFVRLLEVGESDAARHEASAAGLFAQDVDPEVLWTIAWTYDKAGAPEIGHGFARTRLAQYRGHWPKGRWRLAWETAFPRTWPDRVVHESEDAQIPAALTWAIMREESAFYPDARSSAGAIGLMQLMPATARKVGADASAWFDDASLRRPEVSIQLGARLLSSLRQSFPGRPEQAIAAYNAGPVAVRRWTATIDDDGPDMFVERIKFDETRAYVKRVLESEAAYAYLYSAASLDDLP
jgi:soluble lytic murein transglycosylase